MRIHKYIVCQCVLTLWLSVLMAHDGFAQRINFGAYTTSQGISLITSGNLDFNAKQPVIASGSNSTVTIALTDGETQYIAITGDATRDVTVTVSAPQYLITGGGGGSTKEIPFTCRFAYSNLGSIDATSANGVAIQVPSGFTAITFPLIRRAAGVPAPPPTPAHGAYTPPTATAYLFLYGSLGPVGSVSPGNYSGTVNVNVQY